MEARIILPEPNPNIDILFVIDNSGSMYDEQESLATWAQQYLFGFIYFSGKIIRSALVGMRLLNQAAMRSNYFFVTRTLAQPQ